jgi:hypothetical protein
MKKELYLQTQDPDDPTEPTPPTGPTDPIDSPVPGEPDPYPVSDPSVPGEPAPVETPPEPIPGYPPDVRFLAGGSEKIKDGNERNRGDGKPQYHPLQQRRVPEFFYRIM